MATQWHINLRMNRDSKERLKWLIVVVLALVAVGLVYSLIRDDLRGPPADQILEHVTNVNGFTIENVADTGRIRLSISNVGKYPDPLAALSKGFHWVTYNGRTYRRPYGARGMIYRPEFRAENDVLVRTTHIGLKGRERYQAIRTALTDTATDTDFAIAERWYGLGKTYKKQQWFHIESFLYEVLKPGERDIPVSLANTSIQGFDVSEHTNVAVLPYESIEPFLDGCEQPVTVTQTDGGRRGITDGVWEWYLAESLDYVFCRGDSIFLLTTNGHPRTTMCELVWLSANGQFLGRFQLDLKTNAYRSPYRVHSFQFDRDTITFDWLTGGIYPDSGPSFVPLEDRKPTKRGHITIDLTSVDRSKTVFNQRAVEGLTVSRQARERRKSWDRRIWPDHMK